MSYSQKYALVHFIPSVSPGTTFPMSQWLLHVTLADVFAIDRRATDIDKKLAALCMSAHPTETAAIADSILGTAHVVLLKKTPPLLQLHTDIISLLEKNGAVFNHPHYTRDGFIPHSTIQTSGRLSIGETIAIDTISLVDMFPDGDWEQRRVLATFPMSGA
ncbi:2'-5' RNA ligase family protein [Streptomyces caniscabiei]|uniref:2'-5' RNA ligase family protein n=1 Tax=Streptomyces caniscabiei TaxID=2746961 RepID=UPI0029A791E1|nr:2'-5' RNA ligase family protein [Streptomyces caniscabiei]MDX2776609.1 2'-5' RNA ligase family protein [Streptomyces caniscabiei]